MKLALTGHTGYIGNIIQQHFSSVQGFSRSNGFDIRYKQKEIIEMAQDCDIFINCAHGGPGFAQTEMFWNIFKHWQFENKTIINIGSSQADYSTWTKIRHGYCSEKSALSAAVEEAQHMQRLCKVSIINPCVVNDSVAKDLITAINFCIQANREIKSIDL